MGILANSEKANCMPGCNSKRSECFPLYETLVRLNLEYWGHVGAPCEKKNKSSSLEEIWENISAVVREVEQTSEERP